MYEWTDWVRNPFKCIDAVATDKDRHNTLAIIKDSMNWDYLGDNYLDDLLQEIAGYTNIVVQYEDRGGIMFYRAARDE